MSDKFVNAMVNGHRYSLDRKPDLDNCNKLAKTSKETIPIYIQSKEAWKNYTNPVLYETEVALRKWFEIKMQDKNWVYNRFAKRYTYRMIIEEIFNRPYDPKIDAKYTLMCSRLFAHYCGTVTNSFWDTKKQKTLTKTAYNFSVDRIRKAKAYSIRLRVEDLMAAGELPTVYNTKPAKDITPNFYRRKSTRIKSELRSKKAKEAYAKRNNKKAK